MTDKSCFCSETYPWLSLIIKLAMTNAKRLVLYVNIKNVALLPSQG